NMVTRVIGEHIELRIVLGTDLWPIRADAGQIEQVLMNLCVNARDAMPDGGTLIIETENVALDAGYAANHDWAKPGDYVLLSIADTGQGMSPETARRVFEPFFTTKDVGKGTGLGLATVYGIVQQHVGMIQLYSAVGSGTTFKVYLPATKSDTARKVLPKKEQPRGGSETLLVAEDNDAVRKMAVMLLEKAG
ncbi:MAG: hybrid sensor histidine kinase/response regulator, partial [Candidatus Eremiobacteraeota bacterium]|nr:hybrid sensor histidine kinase/response regulator [Candidatus Eremiobacteraeota bacterium]